LELRVCGWFPDVEPDLTRRLGQFIYSPLNERFYVFIRQNISENKFVHAIIHELEHYDLAKILLSIKVPTVPGRHIYPEWVHSQQSYTAEEEDHTLERWLNKAHRKRI